MIDGVAPLDKLKIRTDRRAFYKGSDASMPSNMQD